MGNFSKLAKNCDLLVSSAILLYCFVLLCFALFCKEHCEFLLTNEAIWHSEMMTFWRILRFFVVFPGNTLAPPLDREGCVGCPYSIPYGTIPYYTRPAHPTPCHTRRGGANERPSKLARGVVVHERRASLPAKAEPKENKELPHMYELPTSPCSPPLHSPASQCRFARIAPSAMRKYLGGRA